MKIFLCGCLRSGRKPFVEWWNHSLREGLTPHTKRALALYILGSTWNDFPVKSYFHPFSGGSSSRMLYIYIYKQKYIKKHTQKHPQYPNFFELDWKDGKKAIGFLWIFLSCWPSCFFIVTQTISYQVTVVQWMTNCICQEAAMGHRGFKFIWLSKSIQGNQESNQTEMMFTVPLWKISRLIHTTICAFAHIAHEVRMRFWSIFI